MMSDRVHTRTSLLQGQLRTLVPMLLWMALIAAFSGPIGSEVAMRRAISWFALGVGGHETGMSVSGSLVWAVRKALHLSEYAVLAALALRWVESFPALAAGRAWYSALGIVAGYAALDELHQSLVPARTASGWDVGIDVTGALLGLGLVLLWRREGPHFASRLLDIVGAVVGLALGAPLLLAAAAAVWITMGRPVLFRQRRVGRGERPFELVKLRTMNERRGPDGKLLPVKERLTPVGRWLRGLSIDEIPQLWHVLRGEMSLVGPRPLYPQYLPYYTERERTRHLVRPGLTGLAQVSGRDSLTWDERLELDAQYVARKSLALDLRLLLLTAGRVLSRRDVRDGPLEGALTRHRRHRPSCGNGE